MPFTTKGKIILGACTAAGLYVLVRGIPRTVSDLGYLTQGIGHVLWHGVQGKGKEPVQDSTLERKVKEAKSGAVEVTDSGMVIREPIPSEPEMKTFTYSWGNGREINLLAPKPALPSMIHLRSIWTSRNDDELAKKGFLLMDALDGRMNGVVTQENVEKVLGVFYSESLQPYGGADEIKRLYDKAQAELRKLPVTATK